MPAKGWGGERTGISMGRAGVVTPESRDSCEHLSQLHHIKTRHQRCACWGLEVERGTSVWREGTLGRYLFSLAFPSHPHRPYVSSCTTSHRLPLPTFPLLYSPYIPQKWSLLPFYTPSAHTTPGYTLCPCAHSRWSGGGSPLGQEWAEVRGGTESCPPGALPIPVALGQVGA